MKKRTVFIGALLSLLPLGQPLLIGTGVALTSSAVVYSLSALAETKNAKFFYERGNKKVDKGNFKEAIVDYTEAIKINPDYGDAFFERGYAKENLNDYEGALSDYNEGLKIYPEDGEGYFDRFRAKLFSGDFKGAVSDRNKALQIFSKNNSQLSVKDIISPKMLKKRTRMWKAFNRAGEFNGITYEKPITYYIHDENSQNISKHLPKAMRKSYEISDDEEQFIVDIFSYIDSNIDLDFLRVNSKNQAMISIYKTDPDAKKNEKVENGSGVMSEPDTGTKYKLEIAWAESPLIEPKLNNYPTLSIDDAFTIAHEIGHALGLEHYDTGCVPVCSKSFDPEDRRFNNKNSVMSYNNLLYPEEDSFFTELDIKALRQVWGVEKEN